MLRGLYIAGSGLMMEHREVASVAANVDNLRTPGYQAVATKLQAFPLQTVASQISSVGRFPTAVITPGQWLNTAPGSIEETGRALDIALPPDVYLTVRTPSGQTAYSRDGELSVDGQGRLVTAAGDLVLSNAGAPLVVGAAESTEILANGTVMAAGKPVGTLGLVSVSAPAALQRLADGALVTTPASGAATAVTVSNVRSGALEMSNVSLVHAMQTAMSAYHAYGLDQAALHATSTTLQLAAQQVGKVG